MNKSLYYLVGIILLFSACRKDEVTYTTKVETLEKINIVGNTATSGGVISSDGKPTIKECGIEWCTTDSFDNDVQKCIAQEPQLGEFSCLMTDLQQRTKYYYRAYAKNSFGIIYGQTESFTTPALPVVITTDIEYTTGTTFTAGGEVLDDGDSAVIERGVCWNTDTLPTILHNHKSAGQGLGKFSTIIENLSPGTRYYVRAYAKNAMGVGYGETKAIVIHNYPTITTKDISNISYTTAVCGGNITDNGGSQILSCGVCWAISPATPTLENSHTEDTPMESFTSNLSNLEEGVTYNVRAYATNSIGTAYGQLVSFQTDYHMPTVITSNITDISTTTATGGGNVTSDGGASVTERGICYSTSQNPTTANTKVTSGSGTGSFTCNLTGLTKGTTYYVRAYAVNSKGTAYGEQKSFTTSSTAATVTTATITNITATTATGGGNVTSDGGASVTERGICYSTSQNPTTANTKVTSGSGTGSFTCNLTGLTKGTTYYVRAYAVNSKGTAYGEQKSFTTISIASDHLTFISHQNGSTIGLASLASHQTIEYSIDGATWTNLTTSNTITLNNGKSIYMRGVLTSNNSGSDYTQFDISGSIEAKGNINYLWNYKNLNAPLVPYCGYQLFKACVGLTHAPELPSMTLVSRCYNQMFYECTSLISAPALPATTLAEGCYWRMFRGCTSLSSAPELPASTLASHCYNQMFMQTAITSAPILPAKNLSEYCYYEMFYQCAQLKQIKCFATNISATGSTTGWVTGVASSGTFVKSSSMSSWTTGKNGIPAGWTIVNQ